MERAGQPSSRGKFGFEMFNKFGRQQVFNGVGIAMHGRPTPATSRPCCTGFGSSASPATA